MESFYKNTIDLLETIEETYEKRQLLPCLALLYTGIDVASSLERRPDETTKLAFARWSDAYVMGNSTLPCTSLELYGARCGIVHTFTAKSNLSQKGVREIIHAWGNREAATLQQASDLSKQTNYVAVHIRDLIDAFRHGLADYWDEVIGDEDRRLRVATQVGDWFTKIGRASCRERV